MKSSKLITRDDLPNFLSNIRRLDGGSISINGLIIKPNGFVVGVPKTVFENRVQVGNVTTGLDPLHSYTLPLNSLASNGDWVRVRGAGRYANTENDKQIRLRFDSNLVISFGAVIDLEDQAWFYDYEFVRISATKIGWMGHDLHGQFRMADGAIITSPSGHFNVPRVDFNGGTGTTVADLNNNSIVIDTHGEGTSTDDVVQSYTRVEICQIS